MDNVENGHMEKGFVKKVRAHSIDTRLELPNIETVNWKQRFWLLQIQKKKGFIILSFIFCFFHVGVLCSDVVSHLLTESFNTSSYSYTVALLMSHVVSFYWALLGAVYSLQSEVQHLCLFALLSTVLNFWVIVGRTWFEFIVIQFREEIY